MSKQPAINRIERQDVGAFAHNSTLDLYQHIATKSAIYPGQGTPFGLMYAALGLAEAGEVQNKVKKAFRDDDILRIEPHVIMSDHGEMQTGDYVCSPSNLPPERRAQIVKELGGALWYIAAVCNEIGATMSEVALQNLEELCSRGERDTLRGDGDDR